MTKPPPRSALIVGAGLMGRWHAHALRRSGISVGGVVDSDGARARALAGKSCPVFTTIEQAVATVGSPVAHVCTPLTTHVAIVSGLLEAGLHVIVEKPLATSRADTEVLLDMADRQERLLCPVHQFMFQDGFLSSQRLVGDIGGVLHLDYVAVSAGASNEAGSGVAEAVVEDILPHPLSLMRRHLGVGFNSVGWADPIGPPGEFHVVGRAEETTLSILISMRGRPTRNTLRVVCEGGTLHVDLFHGFVVLEGPRVSRGAKVMRPFSVASRTAAAGGVNLLKRAMRREPAYPGLRGLVRQFHAAVAEGSGPPIGRDEVLDVAAARDLLVGMRRRLEQSGDGCRSE
jgi:predicted dehydrogenase